MAGLRKGKRRAESSVFAGKGQKYLETGGLAGCCRGLVQPGVRTDTAATAAAVGMSVGETCRMLA